MKFDKRLEKLESVTPEKEVMNGLGQYYEWEKTPEGRAELAKLYPTDQEAKKMMADYHKDLRERGLL